MSSPRICPRWIQFVLGGSSQQGVVGLKSDSRGEGGSAPSPRAKRDLRNSMSRALRGIAHLVDQLPEILRQLADETGHTLIVEQSRDPRLVAFQLVSSCARLEAGLEALVGAIDGFADGSDAMNEFSRLVDEWYALDSVPELEPIWPRLKSELETIPAERMTGFYLQAVGPRPLDLPHHCASVWDAFVRLVNRPANPEGVPPWLTLLMIVRSQMSVDGRTEITEALDQITADWHARGLLAQAEETAASSVKASIEYPDSTGGIMIVSIEPDSLNDELFTLSHGVLVGDDQVPAETGEHRQIARSGLEAQVERILRAAEATWGRRLDDIDLEFLLPFALINEPVEWWGKDLSIPLEDRPSLAQYYQVVLRSTDRFTDPAMHRLWRKRWNRLRDHPDQCQVKWADGVRAEHLHRLEAELLADENCVGLVLSSPPNPIHGVNQEFAVALRVGLPLILWHRDDCDRPDFRQIASILVDKPLVRVPIRASRLRQQVGTMKAAQRDGQAIMGLAVVWDNPTRLHGSWAATGMEASGE